MSLRTRNYAILALIVANIIWGAASPIFKLALQNIPPFTLAYFRFLGAALLLFPFAYKNLSIKKTDMGNLFLFSFFGITVNITFFFLGLTRAPSLNAPIIASSGPVFLYLFSIFFLKEKIKKRILIGIIVSLLGVFTIIGLPLLTNSNTREIIGNLFFVFATLGSVGHAILGKKIMNHYSAVTITFWSFVIGAFTFLPLFLGELTVSNPFLQLDFRGLFGLVFGIFLSSAAAYLLFDWGIKRIDGQEIGLFTYIDPVIAALLAFPLLGEKITPIFLLACLLVFGGIIIAEGRLNYHPLHKLRQK